MRIGTIQPPALNRAEWEKILLFFEAFFLLISYYNTEGMPVNRVTHSMFYL